MSENEGWGFPMNSKKAHYFQGDRSLCGRWMFFGMMEDGNDNSPDNCKACKEKLSTIRAAVRGKVE